MFASPLLLSDHRLLVATVEGALLTLDTVTGTVVTKLPTPGPVFGSPVTADDGSVLLGCQDGSVLRVVPQEVPQDVPHAIPQHVLQDVPQKDPQDFPQYVPQDVPQDVPQNVPQDVLHNIPQDVPQDVPQDWLKVAWRTEVGSGVVASPDLLDCGQVLVCCTTRGTVQLIGKERGNIMYSSEPFTGEIFSSPLTFEVN